MADESEILTEIAESVANKDVIAQIEQVFAEHRELKEDLVAVNAMLVGEDIGWSTFGSNDLDAGLVLEELHRWAWKIREQVAANAHIKRGLRLRTSYVWRDGMKYRNIPGAKQGRGVNVQARIDNPVNQKHFFGPNAREEREAALYSDSAVFYLGDDRDYTLRAVPIWQILGYYSNPDDHSEVWAYMRVWQHWEQGTGVTPMRQWYITDRFPGKVRPKTILFAGYEADVDPHITIFEGHVNGQIGWPHGVPDALPAIAWSRLYREFLVNGSIMSKALAQFAFQATVATKKGTDNLALQIAQPRQAGSTVVTGMPNQLVPMSSAGKGYDFSSGNEIAAAIATALEVSMIHLTSNPGSAAGSYGSAQTLDMPTKLAVESRRQWHIEFDKRILAWMGAKDAVPYFGSQDDLSDVFRQVQALLLAWSSGLYSAEAIETRLSEIMLIVDNKIPKGVITPNNSEGQWMITTDKTADPNAPAAGTGANTNPADQGAVNKPNGVSPGQGKSTGVGKTGNANDLRTDKLANSAGIRDMLNQMQEFIDSEERRKQELRAAER